MKKFIAMTDAQKISFLQRRIVILKEREKQTWEMISTERQEWHRERLDLIKQRLDALYPSNPSLITISKKQLMANTAAAHKESKKIMKEIDERCKKEFGKNNLAKPARIRTKEAGPGIGSDADVKIEIERLLRELN